ncbi:MAG: helix-turn-helix transcriptional regulator [Kofleriaceae bacterium]|nr:helix-turn-helix transcriptional regulator [Kofleriaceae bacterium]
MGIRVVRSAVAPIDLVEAAYNLDLDDAGWLAAVAAQAARSLDDGNGIVAHLAESATMRVIQYHDTLSRDDFGWRVAELSERSGPNVHQFVSSHHARLVAGREQFETGPGSWDKWTEVMGVMGPPDFICFFAHTGGGEAVVVWNPSSSIVRTTPAAHRSWLRIAAHLGAACRLRRELQRTQQGVIARASAVITPGGRVVHAEHEATSARERLRDAVRAMEKARGPLRRRSADEALAMWRGLVDGRWSLVDHFDSDGKRFIVAAENRPHIRDPRALRQRESAALELARGGAAPKDIAYALGISPSNARSLLAGALKKLGLANRGDLYRWRPDNGEVIPLTAGASVLAIPETGMADITMLTAAEREVVAMIREGASNREIARSRGTSTRTVANQVASVLRKLGVFSRADIVAASGA